MSLEDFPGMTPPANPEDLPEVGTGEDQKDIDAILADEGFGAGNEGGEDLAEAA